MFQESSIPIFELQAYEHVAERIKSDEQLNPIFRVAVIILLFGLTHYFWFWFSVYKTSICKKKETAMKFHLPLRLSWLCPKLVTTWKEYCARVIVNPRSWEQGCTMKRAVGTFSCVCIRIRNYTCLDHERLWRFYICHVKYPGAFSLMSFYCPVLSSKQPRPALRPIFVALLV